MYGREYGDHTLRFEASGGLLHSSLVMQDKETDTYWSIMTGDALAGNLSGTPLDEMAIGVKAQWRDWIARYPETKILAVDGVVHPERNPYDQYFESPKGYRGAEAADSRLPTKEPIFVFQLDGVPYAVPYEAFEGGAVFEVGERHIFLHRPAGVPIFHSTGAFVGGAAFRETETGWTAPGGGLYQADRRRFVDGGEPVSVEPLDGFDTFWFNWSMTHPESRILGGGAAAGR